MAVQDTDSHPARQDFESLAMWLRLANTPGVSRLAACQLLQQFHSPSAVFAAANLRLAAPAACSDAEPPPALPRRPPAHECSPDARWMDPVGGADGAARHRLVRFDCDEDGAPEAMSLQAARLLGGPMPERLRAQIEAALAWAALPGNYLVTLGAPAYPPTLQHIPDPPLVLFAKGRVDLLKKEAVALVGARNASAQGKANARQFARALALADVVVVSGLALGIDAAAHEGALEAQGGTVAVIGTGIDRIYPRRNAALAHRIAEEGCLVSEFPLGAQVRAENFPIRNRIIAGMARATLVVEAAARSGSLITAHAAVAAGREVFALPGSVLSPQSVGCHVLIREGARLVASPEQLLEDLGLAPVAAVLAQVEATAGPLLQALGHDPVGADELATRLQLDPSDTQASLLALELAGVVERLPGGAFQRLKGR